MKKLILFVTIISLTLNCFSQAPNWTWAKQAAGTATQECMGIATDVFGNVYATGYFWSSTITFGSITLSPVGSDEMYIVKYSPTGTVLWAQSAGGTGSSFGISVATDLTGNVYLTGYFNSPTIIFGSDTLSNGFFVVKYSSSGTVIWAKGGLAQTESIATDALGNVFVTGWFVSTFVLGTDTLSYSSGSNIFTAKYSPSGAVLWARRAGGNGGDEGNSIATDATGNVYITGCFSGSTIVFDTITLTNPSGNYHMFIAKYSPLGAILWVKIVGGTSIDYGMSITTDAFSNAYVTGYFKGTNIIIGANTLTNADITGTTTDMFISKFKSDGTILLSKSAGGINDDKGYSITTDASDIYLTGGFYSPTIVFGSDTLNFAAGAIDPMFIVKYDSTLNIISSSSYASGGDDIAPIATDGFGNEYVGGDFKVNPFVLGTDTLSLTGIETFFIAKCSFNSSHDGTNELLNQETVSIYPNPFTSQTTIAFTEQQTNTLIKITDVLGREIKTINFTGRQLVIDGTEMQEGIYFAQVTDGKKKQRTANIRFMK